MRRSDLFSGFVVFVTGFTLVSDFVRLHEVEDELSVIQDIVESELANGEIYEQMRFETVTYICQEGCLYADKSVVRYELRTRQSFIMTLGPTEVVRTRYFFLDKSKKL